MDRCEFIYWVTCSHGIFYQDFNQDSDGYFDIKKNRVKIECYYREFRSAGFPFSTADRLSVVRWLTEYLEKEFAQ